MSCFGQSRHLAKQEYKENIGKGGTIRTVGIHSFNTFENYKQETMQFINFLKVNNADIKKLNDVKEEHVREYLLKGQIEGKSPYTMQKRMACLNKIFNMDLTKKKVGLNPISYKNIFRGREEKTEKRYNPENYKEQILIAKSFGLRRESILGGQYQIKNISIYQNHNRIYCSVIEKGGKYRNVECLNKFKEEIIKTFNPSQREKLTEREFKKYYKKDTGDVLFNKYTNLINNHSFRRDFAQDLYKQLADTKINLKTDCRGQYDKEILQEVSRELGHNRLDVVIENYLR